MTDPEYKYPVIQSECDHTNLDEYEIDPTFTGKTFTVCDDCGMDMEDWEPDFDSIAKDFIN